MIRSEELLEFHKAKLGINFASKLVIGIARQANATNCWRWIAARAAPRVKL